ncbi:DUF951 family protein [Fusibacter tunisiensis]|uniref:DUF951 domain-containing protein n=1 Tax=Fusibacter tunisiensis TaxID=1008308 RepID=A0ABS2MNI2_9FIRM|nr:hypothetical protein [Fusibacter tunisiensis]
MPLKLEIGDVITTKKEHPCGSNAFEITRVGVDFRIKCQKCHKEIWIPRVKLEKRIRTITRDGVQVPK